MNIYVSVMHPCLCVHLRMCKQRCAKTDRQFRTNTQLRIANIIRSNMCLLAIPTSTSASSCLITGLDQQSYLKTCLIVTMPTTAVADVQYQAKWPPCPRISNSIYVAFHVRHGAIGSMAGLPISPASLGCPLEKQACNIDTHVTWVWCLQLQAIAALKTTRHRCSSRCSGADL